MSEAELALIIREVNETSDIPWDLLLTADPSKSQIERSLASSRLYGGFLAAELVGAMIVGQLTQSSIEILNLAVAARHQRRGFGRQLLRYAIALGQREGFESIRIGTGNSSIGQLAFYQSEGFRVVATKENYFLEHYEEPIFENGLHCTDMVILEKPLL